VTSPLLTSTFGADLRNFDTNWLLECSSASKLQKLRSIELHLDAACKSFVEKNKNKVQSSQEKYEEDMWRVFDIDQYFRYQSITYVPRADDTLNLLQAEETKRLLALVNGTADRLAGLEIGTEEQQVNSQENTSTTELSNNDNTDNGQEDVNNEESNDETNVETANQGENNSENSGSSDEESRSPSPVFENIEESVSTDETAAVGVNPKIKVTTKMLKTGIYKLFLSNFHSLCHVLRDLIVLTISIFNFFLASERVVGLKSNETIQEAAPHVQTEGNIASSADIGKY